jgi:hypothetical protein
MYGSGFEGSGEKSLNAWPDLLFFLLDQKEPKSQGCEKLRVETTAHFAAAINSPSLCSGSNSIAAIASRALFYTVASQGQHPCSIVISHVSVFLCVSMSLRFKNDQNLCATLWLRAFVVQKSDAQQAKG